MMLLASVLELVGVIMLGLPPIRILQANLRFSPFNNAMSRSHPEVVRALKVAEMEDFIWPSLRDVIIGVSGLLICCLSVFMKIIHYYVDANHF